MPPSHIAIIGGGLTGLSSAIHLASRLPAAKITLVEQSTRLGGWVNSKRVHVKDGRGNEAHMLLEKGPRTLRPNAHSVLEMINVLQLHSSVITVPDTAPAARMRFLHIPGSTGLAPLPIMPNQVVETDLGLLLAGSIGQEVFRRQHGNASVEDKSVDEFLSDHFGEDIARLFGSALVHGIYAADSRVLSVRAAFPFLWRYADRGKGSVIRGFFLDTWLPRSQPPSPSIPYFFGDVQRLKAIADASVFSFKRGMITLPNAMENALKKRANVEVIKNEKVTSIESKKDGTIPIHLASGRILNPSHIVSAVPLPAFRKMVEHQPHNIPPHLTANPSSSVTVVNLVFPPTHANQPIHPEGFGYLVPRDENGNAEVLGTVFDSCSLSEQDEYPSDSAPRFTKMTMMIRADPNKPTKVTQEAVMAHLTRHIAPESPLPDPVYFEATTMRDCIPVPAVGHLSRMREMKRAADHIWHERLEIIGAGVGGVSVGDCIKQGREVGSRWM